MTVKEQNFSKIIKMVDSQYKKEISVKKIAQIVGYEKTYVYRLFQEFLNMPPKQYIAYLRLYDATQQIKFSSGENFEKIATSVGFNEYITFYRAFKKFVGMSPDDYRKKIKDENIVSIWLKEYELLEKKIEKFRI